MNQVYSLNVEIFRNINSIKPVLPICASNFFCFKSCFILTHEKYPGSTFLKGFFKGDQNLRLFH